jgi:YD repeat-containing protein
LNSVYAYDALARVTRATAPVGNILFYAYDLRGAVSSVKMKTPDAAEPQSYLKSATHNARGQRLSSEYGDGQAVTRDSFDPKTFELIRAQTTAADNTGILSQSRPKY